MSRQVLTLIDCHSIEDLPVHLQGADAQSLLTGLVAGWHPVLIDVCQQLPDWRRVDSPPDACHELALLVPRSSRSRVPTGLAERVQQQGGFLLDEIEDRGQVAAQLCHHWGIEIPAFPQQGSTDAEDFFALGYAFWQVRLMTRHLRYASNLDETYFSELVAGAAKNWMQNDAAGTNDRLQAAFDLLAQERSRYFPIDPQWIDLVLLAETTLGASLHDELAAGHRQGILLSGDQLQILARAHPQNVELLRQRIADGTLELVGGCQLEHPWCCLDSESVHRQFRHGLRTYRTYLGSIPATFSRRTAGWTSAGAQYLQGWGFRCAVHAPFDGGELPRSLHSPAEWSSAEGTCIPAWMGIPIDAASPDSFLRLGIAIGESLDSAHTSGTLFAHWPRHVCEWFEDLRRIARYGSVLGEFTQIQEYCQQGAFSGHRAQFEPQDYRTDFLQRWQVQRLSDPLSRWVDFARVQGASRECEWLALLNLLTGNLGVRPPSNSATTGAAVDDRGGSSPQGLPPVAAACRGGDLDGSQLLANVDAAVLGTDSPSELMAAAAEFFADRAAAMATRFVDGLPVVPSMSEPAVLVLNPLPFPRRVVCDLPANVIPAQRSPVAIAVHSGDGERGSVVVDVPPVGFAVVRSDSTALRKKRRHTPQIVEGLTLRNEFFELAVDERSGGVRGLNLFERRGNLLSQQLGIRLAVPRPATSSGGDTLYALTTADHIDIVRNDAVVGQLETRGEMRSGDERLATFTQRIAVARGRRTIELEFEFDLLRPLGNDPWRQYVCSRFAWAEENAKLSGGVVDQRADMRQPRFESPRYVEIESSTARVAILCGGLPCHRHHDFRQLDTLFAVAGETRRRFRLGIAVGTDFPLRAALDFEHPVRPIELPPGKTPVQDAAWFLRVDCKNVWIAGQDDLGGGDLDSPVGLDLRMVETEGRSGRALLECARPIARAARVNLRGEEISQLPVEQGNVPFGFNALEFFQIRIFWNELPHPA